MNIVIVDYGMGNLNSIKKKFNWTRNKVLISNDLDQIEIADKLILPGVGHFGKAVSEIHKNKLWDLLNFKVIEKKTPILGICLGMQLMAKNSEEGNVSGFGWFDATVVKFNITDKIKYKVPHIGWNDLIIKKENPLLKGIDINKKFYFVHSYHLISDKNNDILSETIYESPFISSIWKENIFGVQFHPEKSHEQGAQILKNFYNI